MKKIICSLLAIVLLLGNFSILSFAEEIPMSENFKRVLNNNGELEFNWAPPMTIEAAENLSNVFMMEAVKKYGHDFLYSIDPQSVIDSNATQCKLTLSNNGTEEGVYIVPLKFNYKESKVNQFKSFGEKLSKIKNIRFEDLELLNYWVANPTEWLLSVDLNIARYSKEIKDVIHNKNFEINIVCEGGDEDFCAGNYVCTLMLGIDGVTYYSQRITATLIHRLYIPSGDYNSREEIITAAQNRVDEYFGKGVAEVTKSHRWTDSEVLELINGYKTEQTYGIDWSYLNNAVGNYLFSLKINGKHNLDYHEFVILEDDSKCKKPHHKTVDAETNISIETNNYVPLDSSISVTKITEGQEYNEIVSKIKVKSLDIFDLKLFSTRKNDYVTKLNNGTFEVRIPLSDKFAGKDLMVYYLKDDGTLEEHEVIIKDNCAVFYTNHFSIYTLTAKSAGATTPDTPDNDSTPIVPDNDSATPIVPDNDSATPNSDGAQNNGSAPKDDNTPSNESNGNIILWITLPIAVVVIAAGVAFIVIRKKKSNN
ncbi:MAG: hypothetical protein IKB86_05965 [Clostridia bacterium]|nr:hypothetical protein [Clostridia bacterium]